MFLYIPAFYEGFPTTVVEAMSFGVTVSHYRPFFGFGDAVNVRCTGILIPPTDIRTGWWYSVSQRLYESCGGDEELRYKMALAARAAA